MDKTSNPLNDIFYFFVMQLYVSEAVLQPQQHAVPVRFYAKEAAASKALKGDGKFYIVFFFQLFIHIVV